MEWSQEIARAVILVFGCFELIANAGYLVQKNGLTKARKQHGELPSNATDKQLRVKVICMLMIGVIFFVCGLISYILHTYLRLPFIVATATLALYAAIEASYYRYWKTFGFFGVSTVIFVVILLI